MNIVAALLFLATIPAANWLIGNVGVKCLPDGPCLVPVGWGLMAPSGVLVIGLALVLRDVIQERMGFLAVVVLVAIGAALSAIVAPAALAVASVLAFLASEVLDAAVYTWARMRSSMAFAVLLSSAAGSVVDSALFLFLAFGSLEFMSGQVVGKLWAGLIAAVIIAARRRSAA